MPRIRVAHSPDSDDAFMFWALATGKIDTGDREYEHELADIESLNSRAMAGELDSSFGLFFANSQYVLFKGDSYAARDSQYDEVFEIAGVIALSGLSEIVFLKLEGKPKDGPEGFGGTIILSANSSQKTIRVNGMGRVNLE